MSMSGTRHHLISRVISRVTPRPIFWTMIGIPVAAVLGSFYTLYLAISGSEPELPPQYVSEGSALDADFARAQRAIDAGITVRLRRLQQTTPAVMEATYAAKSGVPAPLRLSVRLTHATLPSLDQTLVLKQIDGTDRYRAEIVSFPSGAWLIELSAADWRLRGRLESNRGSVVLGSRDDG